MSRGFEVCGVVAPILLAGIARTAQTELAARVLPRLALAVPVKTKLSQSLPDGGGGLLAKRNPNPLADNLGHFPQTAVLQLEQGQNLLGGQGAVFLPCLGVNW